MGNEGKGKTGTIREGLLDRDGSTSSSIEKHGMVEQIFIKESRPDSTSQA